MFTYLLACLLDDLIIILLDGCEEFETYIVFQNCIVIQYSYWSPVSVPFSCIMMLNNDIYCAYCLTCYRLLCWPPDTWYTTT